MTGFKGTRNENGRPKGIPNKDTAQIRNSFQLLVENNLKQLEQDLKDLEPKDRAKLLLDLAKFVIPTMRATELNDISERPIEPITFRIIGPYNELEENC
jgi:hypothetical protein